MTLSRKPSGLREDDRLVSQRSIHSKFDSGFCTEKGRGMAGFCKLLGAESFCSCSCLHRSGKYTRRQMLFSWTSCKHQEDKLFSSSATFYLDMNESVIALKVKPGRQSFEKGLLYISGSLLQYLSYYPGSLDAIEVQ